jgi:hypothetical protein
MKTRIQKRLQVLASEIHHVGNLMRDDDQSTTMQDKGVQLQGASAMISEWLQSMEAEQTIQDFFGSGKK